MNPAAGRIEAESFTFSSRDGLSLAGRLYPAASPRAWIVAVPGHGEHAGRYAAFAESAAARGFSTIVSDLRGHGLSGGPRGHTPSWVALRADLAKLLSEARARAKGLPLVLFGHSMGGVIVLDYVLTTLGTGPDPIQDVRAVVVSAPILRLGFRPPLWKVALGRLVVRMAPSMTQATGLDIDGISSDEEVRRLYRDDPQNHDRMSFRWYFDFLDAEKRVLAGAGRLKLPTLVVHGERDPIASAEGSRLFAERAGATLRLFPGLLHEVLNEPERATVLEAIFSWTDGVLAARR
jgi:alpha-beta hydrolase superfamily lysophospholipase